MKKNVKISLSFLMMVLSMTLTVSSCQKESPANPMNNNEINTSQTSKTLVDCNCVIDPSDTITQAEIDMLLYMREEEKLARDVYIAMSDLYAPPVFKNISKSEQHHMDQVLCLLQYYNIPDPASADTGVFNNSELQELYNTLVAQGSVSLVDALTAGATIEDKDIFDLEQDMTLTENPAILNIFGKLSCASGNHIRSFTAHLEFHEATYVPQYISQEEYDGIISLPHQFCGSAGIGQTSANLSAQ
jgi:hypothetical protein